MIARTLTTALALLVMAVPAASADTWTTGLATPNDGQIADCIVTNIDTRAIQVSVELIAFDGTVLVPTFDDCNNAPLPPRVSCQVLAGTDPFYCVVKTSSSKVRAGIAVFDPGTDRLNTYLPATK